MVQAIEEPGRRERKKAVTRATIHRAALELFGRRGFESVTVDEICAAADVARRTFFLHFPSKDALLVEYGRVIGSEAARVLDRPATSAADRIRALFEFLLERVRENAELVRVSVREATLRPAAIADSIEQGRSLGLRLADVIDAGQRSAEFRRDVDPRVAAATLISAYFVLVTEWARPDEPIDLAGALRQALAILLDGLEPEKEERR